MDSFCSKYGIYACLDFAHHLNQPMVLSESMGYIKSKGNGCICLVLLNQKNIRLIFILKNKRSQGCKALFQESFVAFSCLKHLCYHNRQESSFSYGNRGGEERERSIYPFRNRSDAYHKKDNLFLPIKWSSFIVIFINITLCKIQIKSILHSVTPYSNKSNLDAEIALSQHPKSDN